jgi:Holliday junction resolvase-like predicted endonuclease
MNRKEIIILVGVLFVLTITGFFYVALIIAGIKLYHHYQQEQFKKTKYYEQTQNSFLKTHLNKGLLGEYHVSKKLDAMGLKLLLINVIIPTEEGSSEIDLIGMDNKGIYVFEIKNYSGWIYGNAYDKNWTQTMNRNSKFKFYNPIRQNYNHIQHIKNYLNIEDDSLFVSYIVFGSKAVFKNLKNISIEDNIRVLNFEQLAQAFIKDDESRQKRLTPEQIVEYYMALKKGISQSEETKEKHIAYVKSILDKN